MDKKFAITHRKMEAKEAILIALSEIMSPCPKCKKEREVQNIGKCVFDHPNNCLVVCWQCKCGTEVAHKPKLEVQRTILAFTRS